MVLSPKSNKLGKIINTRLKKSFLDNFTILSTYFNPVAQELYPTTGTARPSANEGSVSTLTGWPASRARVNPGHFSDSTPYNRHYEIKLVETLNARSWEMYI